MSRVRQTLLRRFASFEMAAEIARHREAPTADLAWMRCRRSEPTKSERTVSDTGRWKKKIHGLKKDAHVSRQCGTSYAVLTTRDQ